MRDSGVEGSVLTSCEIENMKECGENEPLHDGDFHAMEAIDNEDV